MAVSSSLGSLARVSGGVHTFIHVKISDWYLMSFSAHELLLLLVFIPNHGEEKI